MPSSGMYYGFMIIRTLVEIKYATSWFFCVFVGFKSVVICVLLYILCVIPICFFTYIKKCYTNKNTNSIGNKLFVSQTIDQAYSGTDAHYLGHTHSLPSQRLRRKFFKSSYFLHWLYAAEWKNGFLSTSCAQRTTVQFDIVERKASEDRHTFMF